MSEPEKKKTATKIYHHIFWALILVPVAVAAILPATGPYVLLDEGCVALVFLAAALYLAIFLCQSFDKRKKKRALIIGIVCVLIFFAFRVLVWEKCSFRRRTGDPDRYCHRY